MNKKEIISDSGLGGMTGDSFCRWVSKEVFPLCQNHANPPKEGIEYKGEVTKPTGESSKVHCRHSEGL